MARSNSDSDQTRLSDSDIGQLLGVGADEIVEVSASGNALSSGLLNRSEDGLGETSIIEATPGADSIQIDITNFLFTADFARDGQDLVLTGNDGQVLLIDGYYNFDNPPDLVSPEGAMLRGDTVVKLAGPLTPGAYAQTGNLPGQEAIGQVEKIEGEASVQRADGTVVILKAGDKVFQNDIVLTADGGTLSLTFVDGTIFTLSSAARMVLDELIYDPNGSQNSAVFNLVEGTFVFIAGQVAKNGDMQVSTPVATMGIRGTTVKIDIETINGVTTVEVSLNRDPDTGLGRFTLTGLDGEVIANITTDQSKWLISPVEGQTREIQRSDIDLAQDQAAIVEAFSAYENAQQRAQDGEGFVEGVDNNAAPAEDGDNPDDPNAPPEDGGEQNGGEATPGSGIEGDETVEGIESLGNENPEIEELGGDETPPPPIPEENDTSGDPARPSEEAEEQTNEETAAPVVNPTVSLPTLNLNVTEDGSVSLGGFSLTGENSDIFTVRLSAGSTVTLVQGSGVTLLQGDGVDDSTLVFQGTAAQIQAALNGANYFPTPDADGNGFLSITVAIGGTSTARTYIVSITPVQDAPTSVDDINGRSEDSNIYFGNVLINDSDPDSGDTLSIIAATSVTGGGATALPIGSTTILASGGRFSINSNGNYSFDPAGAYEALQNGDSEIETIVYTISDGNGGTAAATLRLTITGVNDAPVATADVVTIAEDTATATGNVLNNDTDVDTGDVLSVTGASQGGVTFGLGVQTALSGGGLLTLNANGSYTFSTNGAYEALAVGVTVAETIIYSISDGHGGVSSSVLVIAITGENDAPVAVADTAAILEDTATITGDVITNDTDVDIGDTLTVSDAIQGSTPIVLGTATALAGGGLLTLNANGSYTFATNGAYESLGVGAIATETVIYNITDSNGGVSQSTLEITITGENDAPSVVADTGSASPNDEGPLSGNVLSNDSDVDSGDMLTVINVSQADTDSEIPADIPFTVGTPYTTIGGGTITINANGSYTFDGRTGYEYLGHGVTNIEVFNYNATDSKGGTTPSTLTITVTGTNDAPVITGDLANTVNEAGTVTITTTDLNFTDPDDNAAGVTFTVTTEVHGAVLVNGIAASSFTGTQLAANQVSFQHDSSQTTSGSFDVSVEDGNEDFSTPVAQTFNVTVNAINNAPTISGQSAGVAAANDPILNTPNAPQIGGFDSAYGGLPSGQIDGRSIAGFQTGDVVTFNITGVNFVFNLFDGSNTLLAPFTNYSSVDIPGGGFEASYTVTGGADTTLRWGLTGNPATGNPSYNIDAWAQTALATTNEDVGVVITGVQVTDVDISTSDMIVTLEVADGFLTLNTGVAFGLTAGQITGNGTGTITITAAVAVINATLADAAGLTYQGDANFSGADTLVVTANDQGNSGTDPGTPAQNTSPGTGTAANEQAVAKFGITVDGLADTPTLIVTEPVGTGGGVGQYGAKTGEITIDHTTSDYQPVIAPQDNGGYIIAWTGNSAGADVYARSFDSSGNSVSFTALLNTSTASNQQDAAIAQLYGATTVVDGAQVDFVTAWETRVDNDNGDIFDRFAANNLTAYSFEDQSNPNFANGGSPNISLQIAPAVTGLIGGGQVIAYQSFDEDGSGWGIFAVIQDTAGNQFTQIQVSGAGTEHINPAITELASGGFGIAWRGDGLFHYQEFTVSGAKVGGDLTISTLGGDAVSINQLTNGDMAAVWQNGGDIRASVFQNGGAVVKAEFLVTSAGNPVGGSQVSSTALADGGFFVVWNDYDDVGNTSSGVYGQQFNAAGDTVGNVILINETIAGNQYTDRQNGGEVVTQLDDGSIAVTWTNGSDVFTRVFDEAGGFTAGNALALPITSALTDADGSETLGVTISGLPSNFIVSDGVNNATSDGTNPVDISAFTLANITFTAPSVFTGEVTLTVTATATETQGGNTTNVTSNHTFTFTNAAPVAGDDSFPLNPVSEFQVNNFTANQQISAAPAQLTDGNLVYVWQSNAGAQGDANNAIKAGILDTNGGQIVGEFLVNQITSGDEYLPEVVALTNGNFLVSWHSTDPQQGDASSNGIKGIIFNSAGQIVVNEFLVNSAFTTGAQSRADAVALPDGGFAITFHSDDTSQGDTSATGIKAVVFDASGTVTTSEFQVNEVFPGGQSTSNITALQNGNLAITWHDPTGDEIKYRIFETDGTPVISEQQANSLATGVQHFGDLTALDNGGFIITWHSDTPGAGDASGNGIKARIFNADGSEAIGEFLVNQFTSGDQYSAASTQLSNGNIVITWDSADPQQGDAVGYGIKGRIIDASGNNVVSEFLVNEFTNLDQLNSQITALADGGFMVAWHSYDGVIDASQAGIKSRIFNADGTPRDINLPVEDAAYTITEASLLANDTDANADTVSISSVSATSAKGAAVAFAGGVISYDPTGSATINALAAGETTTDTFTYDISDGNGGKDTGTVTVTVVGTNDAPVITVNNFAAVDEGDTGTLSNASFDLTTILTASDVDNGETPTIDTASISVLPASSTDFNGVANFAIAGTTLVMDTANFDSLADGEFAIYDVSFDVVSGSDRITQTTQITFNGVNDAPVAVADSVPVNPVSEFRVNVVTANQQVDPIITQLSDGNLVYVWQSDDALQGDANNAVKAAIYDTNGNLIVSEFLVNQFTNSGQFVPDVLALSNGNFLVTWSSDDPQQGDISQQGAKARVFDSAGQNVTSEFLVNVDFSTSGQFETVATELANGNYVIAWTSEDITTNDNAGQGVRARIFDSASNEVVAEFQINQTFAGHQSDAKIATLNNGNFVVTWEDRAAGEIDYRIFMPDGTPVTGELQANTQVSGIKTNTEVVALNNGGFIITWETDDASPADSNLSAIKAIIFAANGTEVVSEFLVNQLTAGGQSDPEATVLSNGNIVISWASNDPQQGDNSSAGIKAIVINEAGSVVVSEFLINEFTNDNQYKPDITALADGGFAVTWYSADQQQGDTQQEAIKSRLFDADGTPRDVHFAQEDTPYTISHQDLTANDTDVDVNDNLEVTGVSATSAKGAVVQNSEGELIYDPSGSAILNALAEGETTTDTFTYDISDGNGGTDTATVTLTVVGTNDAPVISVNNFAAVNEGDTGTTSNVVFALPSILTASDVDNGETPVIDNASITVIENVSSDFGSIPSYVYDPGTQSITFNTADFDALADGQSAIYEVNFDVVSGIDRATQKTIITINGTNDGQVAVADTASATAISVPSVFDDIDALLVNDSAATGGPDPTLLFTNDGSGNLSDNILAGPTSRNTDVKLADLDGDGDLDALVSVFSGQTLKMINQGGTQGGTEGTFVTSAAAAGDPARSSLELSLGDLDGDGDIDAIVAEWNASGYHNQVLVNDGSGTFTSAEIAGTGIQTRDVALADIDNDGDLDAYFSNDNGQNTVAFNLNNGSPLSAGNWNVVNAPGGSHISNGVIFADVDGDGDQDAIIANNNIKSGGTPANNQLLTNDGGGNFTATVLAGGAKNTNAISAGDLDGDGDLDLIVANAGQSNQILINQGGTQGGTEGVFIASDIPNTLIGSMRQVELVDIDNDGDLDVVVVNNLFDNNLDQTNQVYTNDGSANFTISTLPGGFMATEAIAFGDLDGDGAVAAVDANGMPNIHLSPVTGSVATNDTDVDNNAVLTFALVAPVAGLTMATDGTWVFDQANAAYAPLADGATQNVVASYTVTDEHGLSDQSTLTITVTGTNDQPVITVPGSPTTNEDTGIPIGGLSVSDVDGGTLTVAIQATSTLTLATTANLTVTGNGTSNLNLLGLATDINAALAGMIYLPTSQFSGNGTISIQVTDDGGLVTSDILNITVTPVADAPNTIVNAPTTVGADITPTTTDLVANATTAGNQNNQSITQLDNGGFVISWTSDGHFGANDVIAQVFDASGAKVGSEIVVNTIIANEQGSSSLTQLTSGFVVAYVEETVGSERILFQRFDNAGVKQGGEVQINTNASNGHGRIDITELSGGGFVVTWQSFVAGINEWDIHAQIYNATGTPIGGNFVVDTTIVGDQHDAVITSLASGGFGVAWAGPVGNILYQEFNSSGTKVGTELQLSAGSGDIVSVNQLVNGDMLVVWEDFDDGDGSGVTAMVFQSGGAVVKAEWTVNTTTSGDQKAPSAIALADGGFYIIWHMDDGIQNGIYGQRFDAAGNPFGGEISLTDFINGDQTTNRENGGEVLTQLDNGSVVFTWVEDNTEVYYRVLDMQTANGGGSTSINLNDQFDMAIFVNLADTDLSENITDVTLNGLPVGFIVTDGSYSTTSDGSTPINVTLFDLANLRFTPSTGFEGNVVIAVNATSTESANGDTATTIHNVSFTIGPQVIINGTPGADTLTGSPGDDQIFGFDGHDTIHGGGTTTTTGFDVIDGGSGNDTLTILGQGYIYGGAGNDTIRGEYYSSDTSDDLDFSFVNYKNDPGAITANFTASIKDGIAGGDSVNGYNVADGYGDTDNVAGVFVLFGSQFNDKIYVDSSFTNKFGNWVEIRPGAGDDFVEFDSLSGAARISYRNDDGPVLADMEAGTATDLGGGTFIGNDIFTGANEIRGSNYDDQIFGQLGNDRRLRGHGGDDYIDGRTGDDKIEGESGNDQLIGGGGVDIIKGGSGNDLIQIPDDAFALVDGGTGQDTLELLGNGAVIDFTNILSDRVIGIEAVDLGQGGAGNTITLTNDMLFSGGSNDAVEAALSGGKGFGALLVDGDAADIVNLAEVSGINPASWQLDAGESATIADYNVYTYSDFGSVYARVVVDDDVTVNIV